MNEHDLFDAFNGIDDDLLERSERRAARRLPVRKLVIAAAAVMLLAATVIAAPLLRELLFPDEVVQVQEGRRRIYGDLFLDLQNDEYRIDLPVDSTAPLPAEIEEVRLPHYMIENDWLVSYGEIDARYSEAPVHFKWWDRNSPKWITFEQKCIPDGRTSFSLEVYHGAELKHEYVTIGDLTLEYYTVPSFRNPETWESYPRMTTVYWSDGEYAYHMECSMEVTPEELAQIVLSVDIVEDVTPYLKNDPNNDSQLIERPPLDTHKKPTYIPKGYELKVCVKDEWCVRWIWENEDGSTIHLSGGHGHIVTELYTAESYKDDPEYAHEELQVNGTIVHYIRYSGCLWLIWDDGNFCEALNVNIPLHHVYSMRWEGEEGMTLEDMLAIMESMVEVEDITPYLTP